MDTRSLLLLAVCRGVVAYAPEAQTHFRLVSAPTSYDAGVTSMLLFVAASCWRSIVVGVVALAGAIAVLIGRARHHRVKRRHVVEPSPISRVAIREASSCHAPPLHREVSECQSRSSECHSVGFKHPQAARGSRGAAGEFEIFEYHCPTCASKRPIQYFCRDGRFVPQEPRVVCGGCNTSHVVEPFKTVSYSCPLCKKWQKARMPARAVPLNMYNSSSVSCACGFRGEVPVGQLVDVTCSRCCGHRRELHGTWAADGSEVSAYCGTCQGYQRSSVSLARRRCPKPEADLAWTCGGCHAAQPVQLEELLRTEGLVCCPLCSWVGYPELPAGCAGGRGEESRETGSAGSRRAQKDARKARAQFGPSLQHGTSALHGSKGACARPIDGVSDPCLTTPMLDTEGFHI